MSSVHATGQTQDYCATEDVEAKPNETYDIKIEKKIREKCKEGDIILTVSIRSTARLCDLNRPVVQFSSGNAVCFLAPPRKVY